MKALVVGYGSIGSRHARVLEEMGCEVAVVSRRAVEHPRVYSSLEKALDFQPACAVVANTTQEHFGTLAELSRLGFAGRILVEKPLFDRVPAPEEADFATQNVFAAYNLRFHPILQALRERIAGKKLLAVQAYVGQYLPTWRPTRDYRTTYSARRGEGGGALRDLSHELDYLNWLLGGWQRVAALGGHFSALEIDSDDACALLLQTRNCPAATVQLNYLDRLTQREIIVNLEGETLRADLVRGTLQSGDGAEKDTQNFTVERDFTYRAQLEALLSGDRATLCSYNEGMDVMRLIAATETAIANDTWIGSE